MGYRLYEAEIATGRRVWESPTACDTCHAAAESPHYHDQSAPTEEDDDA